jgi:hypothetical protein
MPCAGLDEGFLARTGNCSETLSASFLRDPILRIRDAPRTGTQRTPRAGEAERARSTLMSSPSSRAQDHEEWSFL